MKRVELQVEPRKVFGRKVKTLRQKGVLPSNLYGKKVKSTALQLEQKQFLSVYKQVGETGIIHLLIAKEKASRPVLISNVQSDPVQDQVLHVDFRQVDLTEKVQVAIPIELIGVSPAVAKGGILVQVLNEVEVEALPEDLPEKFKVDVSPLEEIGQNISVDKLLFDKKKVKMMIEDEHQLVVKIEQPSKEEEKPVEAEKVVTEGEEPAGVKETKESVENKEPAN